MTERLYYKDPGLIEFEGEIISSISVEGQFQTILNRTAFYPTSGGQLHDLGLLNKIEILDVIEDNDKNILHITNEPIGEKGEIVSGQIDSDHRWRNRRQHTAQHILSSAFYHLFSMNTVSVHLGQEYGAIEFDTKTISSEQLVEVEKYANDIVLKNLKVEILFIDSEELDKIPLRRPTALKGNIRIIKIENVDHSACGGTHCLATGEVGPIKFIDMEKIRGRVMIKFLSGKQAIEDYVNRFDVTKKLTKKLTCNLFDIEDKFDKINDEMKSLKKNINALSKELLPIRANELTDKAEDIGNYKIVISEANLSDPKIFNQLAKMTAEIIKGVAILSLDNRIIICAYDGSGFNAGEFAKFLTDKTSLKGGGNEHQAQLGGSEKTDLLKLRALFIEFI